MNNLSIMATAVDFVAKQEGPQVLLTAIGKALRPPYAFQTSIDELSDQLRRDYDEARQQARWSYWVSLVLAIDKANARVDLYHAELLATQHFKNLLAASEELISVADQDIWKKQAIATAIQLWLGKNVGTSEFSTIQATSWEGAVINEKERADSR